MVAKAYMHLSPIGQRSDAVHQLRLDPKEKAPLDSGCPLTLKDL